MKYPLNIVQTTILICQLADDTFIEHISEKFQHSLNSVQTWWYVHWILSKPYFWFADDNIYDDGKWGHCCWWIWWQFWLFYSYVEKEDGSTKHPIQYSEDAKQRWILKSHRPKSILHIIIIVIVRVAKCTQSKSVQLNCTTKKCVNHNKFSTSIE